MVYLLISNGLKEDSFKLSLFIIVVVVVIVESTKSVEDKLFPLKFGKVGRGVQPSTCHV